jgi:uncharacterized phage protein (TIGR02218 family)
MADINFLQKTLTIAEIYRIDMNDADNSTMLLTSHKQSIVYGGYTFVAVPMKRGSIQYHANLEVDKLEITMGIVGIQVGTEQYSIPTCIRRDYFRGARVRMWVVDYSDPAITGRMFWDGYISGEINYTDGVLKVSVGSILDRLSDKFPKVIYSEFCQHSHFSTSAPGAFHTLCELVEASWNVASTVTSGTTNVRIYAPIFAFSSYAEGYWERGKFYWSGVKRSVANHGDGYVDLLTPLPGVPQVDDAFSASPGCNRTSTMCYTKYNNLTHFFGFEHIPKPEILYTSLTQ